jgi:hypothetical protein
MEDSSIVGRTDDGVCADRPEAGRRCVSNNGENKKRAPHLRHEHAFTRRQSADG